MAAILQTTFSDASFAPKGPINNKLTVVQVMAWRRIGDKPLLEPKLIQFTDAYIRH